jgi:ATP-dependent helicase/DNAse subunit B
VEAPRCSDDTQHTQDFYAKERCFWREGTALQKIFLLQKNSFDVWKNSLTQRKNDFSFFNSPVPSNGASAVRELLENAILGSDGCLTVTPTRDLNVYYSCSLAWLYGRIFGAEEYSLEASLLDDTALGILYHRILEKLFSKIRDEERAFDARRLDSYKHWALEITREAIKKESSFKGPLAIPLVSPQAAGMAKKIAGLLELEAKNFNGYRVLELELPVSLKTGELFIKGIIDRVSLSPNGEPVIIDYKTSYLPRQTVVEDLDEVSLSEFQMPLYIKLYEEKTAIDATGGSAKVQGAFFYSINGRELKPVMKATNRDEYDPFLEAAEKQIEEFGRKVKALDFTPEEIKIKDCLGCVYKTACRSAYF